MSTKQEKDQNKSGARDQYIDSQECEYLITSEDISALPDEPIDKVVDPFKRFLHVESASGLVLLGAAVAALVLANTPAANGFKAIWDTHAAISIGTVSLDLSLKHWINDGLMAIFFFVVGLEVKRELVVGELSDVRSAVLPIAAAIGGMLIPAGIYLTLINNGPSMDGWGIPMATDIAFVVGLLALLRDRVPKSLRVMLLSLAIADDIGAIVVIAVGYTETVNLTALAMAVGGIGLVMVFFRLGIHNMAVYGLCMLFVWAALHESGVHPTLAGVTFGLLAPTRSWVSKGRLGTMARRTLCYLQGEQWSDPQARYKALREMEEATRESISPQQRFENQLHPWTSFVIMPLFALANAGVALRPEGFFDPVSLAVICGLFLGKPIGIVAFSWLAVKIGIARLPRGVTWGPLTGAGLLAGIGFTMSLFIAGLALTPPELDAAKTGILVASLLSAALGAGLLVFSLPAPKEKESV
jgi:NhaA family Na+:H+ antiporter